MNYHFIAQLDWDGQYLNGEYMRSTKKTPKLQTNNAVIPCYWCIIFLKIKITEARFIDLLNLFYPLHL